MRQFSQKGLRIDQLSPEAKLVYSGFGLFALAAMLVSTVLYADIFDGGATDNISQYYAGESASTAAAAVEVEADTGPAIEMPEDLELAGDEPLIVQVSARKLLEVTHFHLFTIPIFLLIISHLFMLCRVRPGVKRGIVAAATLATALHIAAPWIVRAAGASWAVLLPVTGTVMGASMTLMTVWPMVAMWRKPPAKPRRATT